MSKPGSAMITPTELAAAKGGTPPKAFYAASSRHDRAVAWYNWLQAGISYATGRTDYLCPLPRSKRQVAARSRRTGRTLRFALRPGSDLRTFIHLFQQEDYRVDDFARFDDLKTTHAAILAEGKRPLIVDCGANNGMSAVYFADAWPEAKVVAIEPAPDNVEILHRNVTGFDVECIPAAITGGARRLCIHNPQDRPNAYEVSASEHGDIVGVTMTEVLAQHVEGCRPFIVKIDIEGYEADLFAGDTSWIDEFPLMIVELHDWMRPRAANSASFLRACVDRDRDLVTRGENAFSFRNPI